MNAQLVAKVLGWLLVLESAAMAACGAFAWLDVIAGDEGARVALFTSSAVTATAGGLLLMFGWGNVDKIPRREGVMIVGLGWLLCGLFGAIPFVLGEPRLGVAQAFFESVSGFTTTGSTAIADLSAWPRGILLWRAVSQWLGGLGILVLFVALLSYLGVGSKSLFRHESSFQTGEATTARIRDTALLLWRIYLVLTAICILGLRALGMTWFDAVAHGLTTVSTGGFSPHNASIGFYAGWENFALIRSWLIAFMLACSLNFMVFVLLVRRKWQRLRDEEDGRWFVLMTFGSAALIATLLALTAGASFPAAFGEALFIAVSIASTCGFTIADYDVWPAFAKILLVALMVVGGCSGSTAGGMKVGRVLVFLKASRHDIIRSYRPHQVFRMHVNGHRFDVDDRARVMMFVSLYGFILIAATLVVSLLEAGTGISLETSFGAALASLSNIGPGFHAVGPTANYAALREGTQVFLGLLMILGRLELYALLVLFLPSAWKKY